MFEKSPKNRIQALNKICDELKNQKATADDSSHSESHRPGGSCSLASETDCLDFSRRAIQGFESNIRSQR